VRQPLLTPGAVVLLAIDAAGEYARETGSEFSRRSWIRQALVEELLRQLPSRGRAVQSLRRLFIDGRGVTESAADAVFLELATGGWLVPCGLHAESTWEVEASRRNEIDGLWSTLTPLERQAIQRAAQGTIALSVAWSKKLRTRGESSSSTSRSSRP
jgi:hypothetical protein